MKETCNNLKDNLYNKNIKGTFNKNEIEEESKIENNNSENQTFRDSLISDASNFKINENDLNITNQTKYSLNKTNKLNNQNILIDVHNSQITNNIKHNNVSMQESEIKNNNSNIYDESIMSKNLRDKIK